MNDYLFDLGTYSRPITTTSPQSQLWFDRGLNWCYGFNHEEAERCFRRAIDADATCAMAWWGIAYVAGPFINRTWEAYKEPERQKVLAHCYGAVQKAVEFSRENNPGERALIRALTARYPTDQAGTLEEFAAWTDAYAAAMRDVYHAFPEDLDVIALYAEAIHCRNPWRLWDIWSGEPYAGTEALEAMRVLESGLKLIEEQRLPAHPGIAHIYIHTMEMSPQPEKALCAADALRDLVPDSGHLCHMPSHIDVLCGHYYEAIVANNKATAADRKYLEQVGPFDFYTTACCHDYHLKMYASMFAGQYRSAIDAANGITNLLTEEVLRAGDPFTANTLEAYYSMHLHVYVRFGRWQAIIDAPLPADPDLYYITTCMTHYAKGIAYAATGMIDEAETQRELFEKACANLPTGYFISNNTALEVLAIGREMLNGELEYRKGNYDQAFEHLQQAAYLDDHLEYTEPWAWMHPPRHALGALLLEQNRVDEAADAYRADLGLDATLSRACQHPNNVWSLHGYVECLKRQGKDEEAAIFAPLLTVALARTDVEIRASCCCRNKVHCCD